MQQLAQQVGRLSDYVGFGLEDIAHVVLPAYLFRHHGIRMGELERKFIQLNGEPVEINLYAEAEKEGKTIIILGGVKSRIYGREVEEFARALLHALGPGHPSYSLRQLWRPHPPPGGDMYDFFSTD